MSSPDTNGAVAPQGIRRIEPAQLRPTAQAKGVTCRDEVLVDEPLMLDPARLHQILTNLVGNAIKFTPKGGIVDISVRREDDDLVIRVCDTGLGISPEFLPHVFERFRQAEAGQRRPVGGLGLGLFISHQIITEHGGTIDARSTMGEGTIFRVRLPLMDEGTKRDSAQ